MQAKYAGACLRQELVDTEPLVARLRQVIAEQKSLLATAQAASGKFCYLLSN